MRLQFTTTLTVDVDPSNDKLRATFIKLVTDKSRELYAPAAMLARTSPTLQVHLTSRDGKQELELFEDEFTQEGN